MYCTYVYNVLFTTLQLMDLGLFVFRSCPKELLQTTRTYRVLRNTDFDSFGGTPRNGHLGHLLALCLVCY